MHVSWRALTRRDPGRGTSELHLFCYRPVADQELGRSMVGEPNGPAESSPRRALWGPTSEAHHLIELVCRHEDRPGF
jgi:hypothetical protein